MTEPTISVVIVNERGNQALAATLDSLAVQRLPHAVNFQVVLVNCGESPKVETGNQPYPLCQVTQPRLLFGYSQRAAARNKGVEIAAGEVILFLAEGLVAGEDLIASHWGYHATGQRLCVVGELPGVERERGWLQQVAPWAWVNGPSLSLRRGEMERVGGYDVAYAAYEAGEVEFGYRLWQEGVTILFSPEVNARWAIPVVESGTWRGRGMDYLSCKHPELGAVVALWQLEADIKARNGLLHSDAYQHRLRALLLRHSTSGIDDLLGWTSACFTDDVNNLADQLGRWAKDWRGAAQQVLVIASRPSPPPGAALAAVIQAATKPVAWRPFLESQELGEMAFLRLAQRLAEPKIKSPATRELLSSLSRALVAREQKLRQAGLNWARIRAQGSVVRLWNHQAEPSLLQERQFALADKERNSNCLTEAYRQLTTMPSKAGSCGGPWTEGYSYPPRVVSFKLTHLCNLRCEMCGQWGPVGNASRLNADTLRQQMALPELQAILDQAVSWRPGMIYLWGGEPFLHPDLLDLVAYIRRKGLYCLVTTNGTRLVETADELVSHGLHTLRVSLDGPPEIHDRIRGRPGTFAQAVEGIGAVRKAKESRGAAWPLVEIFCTISPSNYGCLEALVDQLEPVGVDAITFGHMMHVPQHVGERHQRLFRQLFDVEALAWRGFAQDVTGMDANALMETVGRLQRRPAPFPINFEPPLRSLEDIPTYYQDPSLLFPEKHCRGPWLWAEIHPNGDLSFCDEYPDYIVGNVLQDGFAQVWNGPKARYFRKQVLACNRFPICTPCHLLHLGPSPQD